MQPDFQHAMVAIIAGAGAVFAIAATLLFLAFRAFRTARRGDIRHVVLLIATIAFVLVSCVGLLIWSMMK